MIDPPNHGYARLRRCLLAIASFASIPLVAPASEAVFQRLKTTATIPCHHRLSRISDIPYQCWEFQDPDAKLPVWKQSLGFEFGRLTQAQWETIAIAYASWRTPNQTQSIPLLSYDPEHHYWLMDFMPPHMQAVNRHRFIGQPSSSSSDPSTSDTNSSDTTTSGTSSILTNCWGTLYEILRLKNVDPDAPSYLMMIDAEMMLQALKALSDPVDQANPGDFLLISHRHPSSPSESTAEDMGRDQIYLDHGALFVDEGLLFEKAGAGDRVPYRLIGLSMIQRIWRQDVYDYQIRRPIANRPMPHPLSFDRDRASQSTLGPTSDNTQNTFEIFPLPPLTVSENRATLPPQVYEPSFYQRPSTPKQDALK